MTLKYFFKLIIFFLWLIEPLRATSTIAKPGCLDTCGDVTIRYPFGIGAGCFLNEWFELLCLDNRTYLSKFYRQEFGGEVLGMSIYRKTITINYNPTIKVCDANGISFARNLLGSPFRYEFSNALVFGCGNVMLSADQTILGGCTSTCDQNRTINSCNGINCCQIATPYSVQSSRIKRIHFNFSNFENRSNSCATVYLGSSRTRSPVILTDPVELRWTIPEWMGPDMKDNPNCGLSTTVEGYTEYGCECPVCTEGNPFMGNGCQVLSYEAFCVSNSSSKDRIVLLVSCVTSLVTLALIIYSVLVYKTISISRKLKLAEKFFKQNGGLLLQQQLSFDGNIVDKVGLFTASELEKATDYFNPNRILGRGGQGTVYKGMLVDGRIIAVKKPKLVYKNQVEQFINEVVVLSQINQRNVVKLLGCCLETEIPLLVYEFISNGTLYDLIHNENDEVPMSWDMRLRIATEVAGALSYLHSAISIPIFHRDIKSSNILLDEKYKAKVSDFGMSRHVAVELTHLTTLVKGTFGYLDPEYFQSNQFTEKSDVYSFGVVLVELLTRRKPVPPKPTEEESCLGLASLFLKYMEEDRLNMILDSQVLETINAEQVISVAKIAQCCLNLIGKKRPTMKEVARQLASVKMSHMPSTIQTNFQGESNMTSRETRLISDGISSWTCVGDDTITFSSGA